MKDVKTTKREPGHLKRYVTNVRTLPRLKRGEILCHNHILHLDDTSHGENGFRYFVCDSSPDHHWEPCPCGWRSEWGKHYAGFDHVAYHRERIAAGEPLTMWWPPERAVPPGCERVGQEMIAKTQP